MTTPGSPGCWLPGTTDSPRLFCQNVIDGVNDFLAFAVIQRIGVRFIETTLVVVEVQAGGPGKFFRQCGPD